MKIHFSIIQHHREKKEYILKLSHFLDSSLFLQHKHGLSEAEYAEVNEIWPQVFSQLPVFQIELEHEKSGEKNKLIRKEIQLTAFLSESLAYLGI